MGDALGRGWEIVQGGRGELDILKKRGIYWRGRGGFCKDG